MRKLRSALAALLAAATLHCGPTDQPPEPDPPGEPTPPAPSGQTPAPTNEPPVTPPPTNESPDDPPPVTPPVDPAGPWPTDTLVNYSERYGLGRIKDAAVDEGHNIWVLNGPNIGVLKPGDTAPTWSTNLGQAGLGFASTRICAGAPGVAYVGYRTNDEIGRDPNVPFYVGNFIFGPDGCDFANGRYDNCNDAWWNPERFNEYLKGDLDIVKLNADGTPELDEHIWRNVTNNPYPRQLGLRNTNDHHFDEDRSVLSCTRAVRGPAKGDVFIGTNHGYTRIQGKVYSSHRHPIFYEKKDPSCAGESCAVTQRTGFAYGLGIAQDGDVLMANEWTLGIVSPIGSLDTWQKEGSEQADQLNPQKLQNFVLHDACTGRRCAEESFAKWRGFEQTTDGRYYVGSEERGLWELEILRQSEARATELTSAPQNIESMAATADGSLFIGTGSGLYRMDAAKQITRVEGISGRVTRLFYDPSVTPASLYIVAGERLFVLRGH